MKWLIGNAQNIHFHARGDEGDLRLFVFRNSGCGMQRNRIPNDLHRLFSDAMTLEEISRGIGAVDLEAKLRPAVPLSQANVVNIAPT